MYNQNENFVLYLLSIIALSIITFSSIFTRFRNFESDYKAYSVMKAKKCIYGTVGNLISYFNMLLFLTRNKAHASAN